MRVVCKFRNFVINALKEVKIFFSVSCEIFLFFGANAKHFSSKLKKFRPLSEKSSNDVSKPLPKIHAIMLLNP